MVIMESKVYDVNAKEWIAPSTCVTSVNVCDSRRCLCCKSLDTNTVFKSFSTGRRFILNYQDNFDCKSRNVIYLITCRSCGVQYVGQTKQPLHCRLNGHRQSIKKNKLNTFLSNHFNSLNHSWEDVNIQIIDRVDTQSKTDLEITRELNSKEDFHIKTLNTLHPLGLNDRVLGGGCASQDTADSFAFFSSSITRRKRSHGIRKSGRRKYFSSEDIVITLAKLHMLINESKICDFYRFLKSISDSMLRALYTRLIDQSGILSVVLTTYVHKKLYFKKNEGPHSDKTHIVIPFKSHQIDQLHLSSILYDKSVNSLVPDKVKHLYPPKVYHKLNNPICLRFCNYIRFLNSLTMSDVNDILNGSCSCDTMNGFIYAPYGHVFTGNLNIVRDPSLRTLFGHGTKHRIPKPMSWHLVRKEILESLNEHISSMSRRFQLNINVFSNWRNRILMLVKHRIFRCNNHQTNNNKTTVTNNEDLMDKELHRLQKNLIIVPVDKAANNFSFICKKFYVKVLVDELGFDLLSTNVIGNITYKPENISVSDIIHKHNEELKVNYNISVKDKDMRLPKLFWIPKLHKNPYKFRFIAGARSCTTKRLSVHVNKGLKVIRDNFYKYCEAIRRNTGFSYFWSVASTQEFLHNISNVNVHSMQVFDFSTLYTNLDQSAIKDNVFSILDHIFNLSNRKYLCIGYDKSFFSKRQYKGHLCFDLDSFKKAIDFILSEVFITFAGNVFRQIRGVPMGGNCSPLLADLFLLNCEFSFMKDLVKDKKFGLAKLLSNTSRYIDDICVVNYKHFDSLLQKIYPADLLADRNGVDSKAVVYLDVSLKIDSDGLRTTVYHKVDDFDFPVVLLTFPDSAIPYKMGINVFAGQVLRYCRICSHLADLVYRIDKTLQVMSSRGYCKYKMKACTEKILSSHNDILLKFGFFSARQLTSHCAF